MKNEDRIIELLSEYLQKTDRILDRMEKTDRSVEMMSWAIADHSLKFNEMNSKFNEMNSKFNEMNSKFNEMNSKFNETNTKFSYQMAEMREEQGIVLKELLSISKRVDLLERKG
ncbi:MAG: hypothetical protein JST43_02915 [Bacteroidetes bacterium]|nr:hypothetical protein [Bacteroidota bacterium]MBS1540324.1 hypothetical protein [Bacteroidota bacterium]